MRGGYHRAVNIRSKRFAYKEYSKGERVVMGNTQIFRDKFPYVEIEGLKYVPEGTRNEEIFFKYRYFYTNKVFRKYYMDAPESYTKGMRRLDPAPSMYAMYLYKVNHYYPSFQYPVAIQMKSYAYIARFGLALGYGYETMRKKIISRRNKVLFTLMYPAGVCAFHIKRKMIKKEKHRS